MSKVIPHGKITVGSIVQIRDTTGFAKRTYDRFIGRCCKVESVTPGLGGYNAHVRIIGCEDEPFNSLTVKVSRLVRIQQLPKGTKPAEPEKPAPYVQKDGDIFVMTGVQYEELAGSLLELRAGDRFRIKNKGSSWTLEYLEVKQDHPHYTDKHGCWINALLQSGVIELVGMAAYQKPALAPAFGPVPVDEWSYNSTTFAELAKDEVAELRATNPLHQGGLLVTHVRKEDIGVWLKLSGAAGLKYAKRYDVVARPVNLGWVFAHYDNDMFKESEFLTNGNIVYITAFTYPAMRADLETPFSNSTCRVQK